MSRPAAAQDLRVSKWGARFMGRRFPCAIGKGGMTTTKREGDGATPKSTLRMMAGGYRADRRRAPVATQADAALRFHPIGPRDLWSDDPQSDAYNQHVHAPYIYSHEKLRRADPLYDIYIVTDWNWPDARAGEGSAIFVHNWRRPRMPTEGCIAFRRDHLAWIVAHWTARSRIIIR